MRWLSGSTTAVCRWITRRPGSSSPDSRLRLGFGVAGDDLRIDRLWRLRERPLFSRGGVSTARNTSCGAGGGRALPRASVETAGGRDGQKLCSGKALDELVRLAGSLELLPVQTKVSLVKAFIDVAVNRVHDKRHCSPYLAALGRLLNRAPLSAGPETVVSPDLVERAYAAFRGFDWTEPELLDLQTLFLRGARVVGDRSLDVPAPLRSLIAGKLEQAGASARQTAKVKGFVAMGRSERASLYDESLPAGLIRDG